MSHPLRTAAALLAVIAALVLSACQSGEGGEYTPTFAPVVTSAEPVYVFGVHPLHNPQRLHEVFGPLMAYLSTRIDGARFRLEASRNYAAYDEKLYARQFHFALPNPYQTINAVKVGYRVFGKMGDDENFRGIILVRKDSNIQEVGDLRGKAVSYPAPSALAATMLPQYFLHSHGLHVMRDVDNRYVGSQESSIMNVYLGDVAAGATWLPPWRALSRERPELAAALEVRWQTEPLPNNGLVVLPEVPAAVVAQVSQLLFSLHESVEGRTILSRMELSRFESADNTTYQPVREFIRRFSAEVRPVE